MNRFQTLLSMVRRYMMAFRPGVCIGGDFIGVVIKLTVGRCRLTISKPELKAHLVSALETKM